MRYICTSCNIEYDKVTKCGLCDSKVCRGCLYVLNITNKLYVCKGCYSDKGLLQEDGIEVKQNVK